MSIKSIILDGFGRGNKAKVNREGTFEAIIHPHPPIGETITALPFRQYLTDDGTKDGSNDMTVNGLTTNQDFYISANKDYDIYINAISVEIGDGGSPNLNSFGALSALSNGVGFYWFTLTEGEYELHEGIKTNKEFIRIGQASAGFGDGVNAFLADVSGGGSEKTYLPVIDFSESYGLQYGVKLTKGSTEKLIFRIADNLTGLLTFNAQCFGIRI